MELKLYMINKLNSFILDSDYFFSNMFCYFSFFVFTVFYTNITVVVNGWPKNCHGRKLA